MKRRTYERVLAAALTALLVLFLFVLAGTYQVRQAHPEYVALMFARGASGPAMPMAAPTASAAPRRMGIDAMRIPSTQRTVTALKRPLREMGSKTATLALQRTESPKGSAEQPRASRNLVPRTRTSMQRGIVLTPVVTAPNEKLRTALPLRTPKPHAPMPQMPAPAVQSRAAKTSAAPDAPRTDAIMDWMRLQPSTLPIGIRHHIEYREGSLTSAALLEHEGASYELYLMAHLSLREVHIVLVRDENSYYLIDRSFQREGLKFRVGAVRRNGGVITGIVSEERAASSPEARHYYNVFLQWWDRERYKLQ